MSYEGQKNEVGTTSEIRKTENAANKFFDMAEKGPGANNSKAYEMFSAVGTEIAQGNYDKSQRILESGAIWDDTLREATCNINKMDQERTGSKPITIEDVQNKISEYARELEKMSKENKGGYSDLESSMALDNIAGDISEPGLEGIDNALNYLESTLKSKSNTADSILKSATLTPEERASFLKDWQEKRTMRDALFQEKQKRAEQHKQSQQATKETRDGRTYASKNLENLYDQAGVPENTPSRQEFLTKISTMSPDELQFLDTSLKKVAAEFGIKQDQKLLDGRLMDLVSKSFKPEDIAKRQTAEDQRKIEELRKKLGLPEQQPENQSNENKETTPKREPSFQSEETPKWETQTKDLFEKLLASKKITDPLDVPSNHYTPEKGVAAIVEALKGQYPDSTQFATRVESLLDQFFSAIENAKRIKPTATEEAYRNFANKEVVKSLPASEKQAIETFLNQNYKKLGGKGQRMIPTEMPVEDFISFFESIKNRKF